jgi:hypothetical protein
MSKIKLLPCPFCGGEAEIVSSCFFGWDKQIICKKCGASTRYLCGVTPSQAIKNAVKKWNTRKPMERIISKVVDMKDDCLREYNKYLDGEDLRKGLLLGEVIDIVEEEGGIE